MIGLRGTDDGPQRRRLLLAGVALLVVVDVVLVGLALAQSRSVPEGSSTPWSPTATGAVPAGSAVPSGSEQATPESTDPATPAAPATAEVGARMLAVGGGGVLWRAVLGSCEAGGGLVEVSDDAGVSWSPVALPVESLSSVLTIVTGPAAAQASVAYADAACQLSAQRTFDGGGGWQPNDAVLDVASYVTPDAGLVLAGAGAEAPCAEPRMARGASAALCADGLYVGGAAAWSAPVPGVVAVAPYDEQRVVAASVDASCEGVAVSLVALADGSQQQVACARVASVSEVAVGAGGTTAWVWSGDEVVAVQL